MWATQSAAPAQQWNQPNNSNAAVNVNAATSSVGQNSALWPPSAGANPGMLNLFEMCMACCFIILISIK